MIPKFRAWDSITKKFIEHFFITDNGLFCNMEKPTSGYNSPIPIEKSELILMQSTGLHDKNGKEIFEGDILKFNDEWADYGYEGYIEGSIEGINYVEIKREKTCFTFGKTKLPESSLIDLVENEHYPFEGLLIEASYEFEIIGNVYENPELLEVTK